MGHDRVLLSNLCTSDDRISAIQPFSIAGIGAAPPEFQRRGLVLQLDSSLGLGMLDLSFTLKRHVLKGL